MSLIPAAGDATQREPDVKIAILGAGNVGTGGATKLAAPGEGALDDPAARQHLEGVPVAFGHTLWA